MNVIYSLYGDAGAIGSLLCPYDILFKAISPPQYSHFFRNIAVFQCSISYIEFQSAYKVRDFNGKAMDGNGKYQNLKITVLIVSSAVLHSDLKNAIKIIK